MLTRTQWGIIIAGALIILALVLVYFLVLSKPKPKVVNGIVTEFTVDALGNVRDAQGIYVGRDNGDDSFTTTQGDVMDYNSNLIKAATTPVTPTANTPSGGAVVQQTPATGIYNFNQYL